MTNLDVKSAFRATLTPAPPERMDLDQVIASARRHRRSRRRTSVIGLAAGVAIVVGLGVTGQLTGVGVGLLTGQVAVSPASQELDPSPEAAYFDGLPRATVEEVLANPAAKEMIRYPITPEKRQQLWQGMTLNFIFCRQMLGYYDTWKTTGTQPTDFPRPSALPTHPVPAVITQMYVDYRSYREASTEGLARFKWMMLLDGSCGQWIPAKPGDHTGPTIADIVRGS